jgi:tetratricopeptide (TPR) repeat protein
MFRLKYILLICIFAVSTLLRAQSLEQALKLFEDNDLDGAKVAIEEALKDTLTRKNPKAWIAKANIFQALIDTPDEQNMSQGSDYPLTVYYALKNAFLLDTAKSFKSELNNSLLVNATDMFKEGIQYHNLGINTHDPYLLERAVVYFNSFTHIYQMLGDDTRTLDKILSNSGYNIAKVKFMRAQALDALGNKEKAMKEYRQLQEEGYKDPQLYISLFQNLKKEEKPNKPGMYAVLEEGVKVFPFDVDLQLTLALFMAENKNYDGAIQLLNKLRKQFKDNVKVIVAQAQIFAHREEFTKAESYLKAVYKIDPNDVFVLTEYAKYFNIRAAYQQNSAAERKEYHQKALKLLEKAEELAPSNVRVKDLINDLTAKVPDLKRSRIN